MRTHQSAFSWVFHARKILVSHPAYEQQNADLFLGNHDWPARDKSTIPPTTPARLLLLLTVVNLKSASERWPTWTMSPMADQPEPARLLDPSQAKQSKVLQYAAVRILTWSGSGAVLTLKKSRFTQAFCSRFTSRCAFESCHTTSTASR